MPHLLVYLLNLAQQNPLGWLRLVETYLRLQVDARAKEKPVQPSVAQPSESLSFEQYLH